MAPRAPGGPAQRLAPGLYLVATPIGNIRDITLRAMDVLATAEVLVAEDTRVAAKLMQLLGIDRAGRPMLSYNDQNGAERRPEVMARLAAGESVVYVSDAGTPLIADPGFRLVAAAREAGEPVVAVPGPSAVVTALTVAGLPTDRFLFAGFLPVKSAARRVALAELREVPATLVFYEAPRRFAESFADMAEVLGAREAAVARELTKLHEEIRRGTLAELAAHYAGAAAPKGEAVVLIGPPGDAPAGAEDLDTALRTALRTLSVKDAAQTVAAATGRKKREVYARALELAEEQ